MMFSSQALSRSSACLLAALSFVVGAIMPSEVLAQSTCVRATNRVVNGKVITSLSSATRTGNCRRGEVSAISGPTGLDGQLRIYGDGSSGAKVVASDETLSDASAQFTDVTINSGVQLTVPSGTVIRCTGSFVNNGFIRVQTGASGGQAAGTDSSTIMPAYAPPHSGISARAAMSGEVGSSSVNRTGGSGGVGLSLFQAALLRYPGSFAGGGGAGGFTTTGGKGGGSLVVLCNGPVTNNSVINANGEDVGLGSSGGGGGVVILASKTSVASGASSSINAFGGEGGGSSTATGPGGGGGGGVIHFISPMITSVGATLDVSGGQGGSHDLDVSSSPRAGGPGGGGSGGDGGNGGLLSGGSNIPASAGSGASGHVISTTADPSALF